VTTSAQPAQYSSVVHGSISALHAEREISFFFDPRSRDASTTVCVKNHEDDRAHEAGLLCVLGSAVLARWPSDGWFYLAVLREYLGGNVFCVEDEDLTTDTVAQDEFILVDECLEPSCPGDRVLCEHPRYVNSFCPGTVQEDSRGRLVVVFYDNNAVLLEGARAFRLPDQGWVGTAMGPAASSRPTTSLNGRPFCCVFPHPAFRVHDLLC